MGSEPIRPNLPCCKYRNTAAEDRAAAEGRWCGISRRWVRLLPCTDLSLRVKQARGVRYGQSGEHRRQALCSARAHLAPARRGTDTHAAPQGLLWEARGDEVR